MPTLAVGSRWPRRVQLRGFTLLELLIVVAIVAMASAGVSLALRDSAQSRLDTQAQRLTALLESARAQSHMLGVPVRWRATPTGFAWDGLPTTGPSPLPTNWTEEGVSASSAQPVLLGPEPLILPQSVRLWLTNQPGRSLQVGTDGVRPFAVQNPVLETTRP